MEEHERLVLTDPVTLRFLEDDPSIRTVERKRELSGYELYVVEQWACSRADPTIVITTFTGQLQHKIQAAILEIPSSEKQWSTKLKTYMRSVTHHHARKQNTSLGTLMVTNLSTFPSTLTILPIPGGDLRGHRDMFFVNENLKRLGCSGRAGLMLSQPSEFTVTKFRQLYRTSEQVSINEAVVELVQMCQIALTMFEKLPQEYCDGLLCDKTERGLADWWTEIGLQYYNVEPSDDILGPTTVAALLGLFLGARNRLHAWGAPVSKNAYDIQALKRGIAQFQKSRNLPKTRRLDRETLQRLHKSTAKAATHEGWAVPRAVKSTVAELGKGGEMVMGMVGARDKPGIADVETTDLEQFLKRLSGERCKWLWRGKPRKTLLRRVAHEHAAEDRQHRDDSTGHVWGNSSSEEDEPSKPRVSAEGLYETTTNLSKTSLGSADRDQAARRNVLKSVTGRMTDARSGLGRFRDAVGTGLRGHHQKASRDSTYQEASTLKTKSSAEYVDGGEKALTRGTGRVSNEHPGGIGPKVSLEIPRDRNVDGRVERTDFQADRSLAASPLGSDEETRQADKGARHEETNRSQGMEHKKTCLPALRKAQSLDKLESVDTTMVPKLDMRLRHVSYAEIPSHSKDRDTQITNDGETSSEPNAALAVEQYKYLQAEHMHGLLMKMKAQYPAVATQKLRDLSEIGVKAGSIREMLVNSQRERMEGSQANSKLAEETVQEGRDLLTARLQEIDAMGAKLEYELGVLVSKIEDVEDGVADLDRQVVDLESRSRVLAQESRDHSWHHWIESVARRLRIV